MSYGATGFSPQDHSKGGPEEVLLMSGERAKTVAAMCAAAAQAELPSSPDSPGKYMSDLEDYGGDDHDDLIMRLAEYEAEQEANKAFSDRCLQAHGPLGAILGDLCVKAPEHIEASICKIPLSLCEARSRSTMDE